MPGMLRDYSTFSTIFGGSNMAESIKEKMDRFFGVNSSSLEPLPSREISLEEMLKYRKESKEKIQNKEKRGKGKKSSEIVGDSGNPCPKCGIINWDQFPDGRLYCLKCGAVKEVDGTVTGGAIMKEISKQIKGVDKNMVVICEFKCSECPEVIQAQGKDLEIAKKKVIPHKAYDAKSQCNGSFTFLRQVFPDQKTSISETNERADAFMDALGRGKNPESKNYTK